MEILQQPIFLILLFIVGFILQFISIIPAKLHKKINQFILWIPLPAIVLAKIPFLEISKQVILPIGAAWITFIGAILFAIIIAKFFMFDKKTIACIILCCGLGNTSFVGYPFLQYFYGEESLKYAIFVDQPGSFLILSTCGVFVATYFSASTISIKTITERLLKFPPFFAFIVALFLPTSLIEGMPSILLNNIGKLMVPLALLSLGLQFKISAKTLPWKKLGIGLLYKLMIAPFIVYIMSIIIIKKHDIISTVSIIECAMPPMITASILAVEYDLDSELASTLPTIGILISIPTLFFWKWLIGY